MGYYLGLAFGALIGMCLLGGALGWIIKKVFKRLSWEVSHATALVVLAILGVLGNANGQVEVVPIFAAIYIVAGAVAYFMLGQFRKSGESTADT